jgi:flagellar FliL protein
MSNAAAAPAQEGAAPAKGKGKLLVILVAVFALLAAGGGGAAWFFHSKSAAAEAAKAEGAEGKPAAKKESGKPPVFVTLENFTVNLAGGDHFMQLGLVLQVKDEETAEKIKVFLPQIRSKILLLLSSKTPEELQEAKGKQALIAELLTDAREPLHAEGENVQAVLLGSMLIQ